MPAGYYIIDYNYVLMQIWKSPYMFMFISKQYPENFTFLILRILELFAGEVRKFLTYSIGCLTNFSHISRVQNLKM